VVWIRSKEEVGAKNWPDSRRTVREGSKDSFLRVDATRLCAASSAGGLSSLRGERRPRWM
jgi:hypothetical protein